VRAAVSSGLSNTCCWIPRPRVFLLRHGLDPEGKDPARVDEKLVAQYDIGIGKTTRARRKALGLASSVSALRPFVRPGGDRRAHRFLEDEASMIRDARKVPIKLPATL